MKPIGPYLGMATVTLHSLQKSTLFCDENQAPIAPAFAKSGHETYNVAYSPCLMWPLVEFNDGCF
jgi:hypothetical protein